MRQSAEWIYSIPEPSSQEAGTLIPFINYKKPAPQRCLDMLLAKYRREPYQSEVLMTAGHTATVPELRVPLSQAKILLVTDGGLVPCHNPDRLPSSNAAAFYVYPLNNVKALKAEQYEISHQGYNTAYVEENPNRLLPVDALRELEHEGVIGALHDSFVSTTGVMTSVEHSMSMGAHIARYAAAQRIDAVIVTSACGTSTRCGAYIAKAVEAQGIPAVQVTNLTRIAADLGICRVVKGNHICHLFGNPALSAKNEFAYRKRLALQTVRMLAAAPDEER